MNTEFYESAIKLITVSCIVAAVISIIMVVKFFGMAKDIKDIRNKLLEKEESSKNNEL